MHLDVSVVGVGSVLLTALCLWGLPAFTLIKPRSPHPSSWDTVPLF